MVVAGNMEWEVEERVMGVCAGKGGRGVEGWDNTITNQQNNKTSNT